jgi:MFS family permease
MLKNALLKTMLELRGNPRACCYTEPLWGLSMNLVLPYASVYMLALGLNDIDVGLVATIYMLSQVVFAFLSGPLTDKLGRRITTGCFDFIAWSVPCLIWWAAGMGAGSGQAPGGTILDNASGNSSRLWFFIVAALFNGVMEVTTNSWDCLCVEDAQKKQITSIYSLVTTAGQLSAFFAPISSLIVAHFTFIPAVRILYLNAFVVMTLKEIILLTCSRETKTGVIRKRETRGKSILSLAAGYGKVVGIIAHSPGTVFSLFVSAILGAVGMMNSTFWQVIVSVKLEVPDTLLPILPMVKSLVAIFFLFVVMPRISRGLLKLPLVVGFSCYFLGQAILILTPVHSALKYPILCLSLVFDGFGYGTLNTLAESLVALHVNKAERARVMALQHMIIMACTAPFGYIGGWLSDLNKNLPFVLDLVLLLTGLVVTLIYYKIHPSLPAEDSLSGESMAAEGGAGGNQASCAT